MTGSLAASSSLRKMARELFSILRNSPELEMQRMLAMHLLITMIFYTSKMKQSLQIRKSPWQSIAYTSASIMKMKCSTFLKFVAKASSILLKLLPFRLNAIACKLFGFLLEELAAKIFQTDKEALFQSLRTRMPKSTLFTVLSEKSPSKLTVPSPAILVIKWSWICALRACYPANYYTIKFFLESLRRARSSKKVIRLVGLMLDRRDFSVEVGLRGRVPGSYSTPMQRLLTQLRNLSPRVFEDFY